MPDRRVLFFLALVALIAYFRPEIPSAMTDSTTPASPIAFEEIAARPLPGTAAPSKLRFSPDDRLITFLVSPDHTLRQELYAFDPETATRRPIVEAAGGGDTEANLSPEEKLRRERQRNLNVGVTRYAWAERGGRMLVPVTGDLYLKDGVDGELRSLLDTSEAPALDPQFSPDGDSVAFVRDAELYVIGVGGGPARQLTTGARGTGKTNGLAEFVAQEEMDRDHGYWWSKDSAWLAFVEVDETHIPAYRIMHQGKDAVGDGAQEDHAYPFAGAANARVRLGVVAATGGPVTWMDLGAVPDIYLARVDWFPDGRLSAQIENREQSALDLVFFDRETGKRTVAIEERSKVWINLHHMLRPLKETSGELVGGFIWASERTGFQHLYLHARDGRLVRQLTRGDWMVDSLAEVDEKRGLIFFLATRDGVTERHLYEVPLAGGEPRRLTTEPGIHDVEIDHACERFVDLHDSLDSPPRATLRSLADGTELTVVYAERDPRLDRMQLLPPRLVTVQTEDGVELHGAVYEPLGRTGPRRTMVAVYGGPHAQTVKNSWGLTADLRLQRLRDRGFVVFKLDNRGMARRGVAFEGALKHDMGNVEVRDQVRGVEWLVAEGLTDPERVGIIGWSYGGYMAAMALGRAPATFKLAVAGAPVTHWDGYDTHYTERYMGTPASNPTGYAHAAVMAHIGDMRGKLMLVHGMLDENVHFRHTARLINALIAARKEYELLVFPDERHSPRKLGDRVYMEQRIDRFIEGL